MNVLVDTSVWSLALRRKRRPGDSSAPTELGALILDGRVAIIGPIRQELLSGVKETAHYDRLRDYLRAFPDVAIATEDYEEAASLFNHCRARGIQGSNTDFLICAVAIRNGFAIFTTDADFTNYATLLPISLHSASS